MHVVVVTPDFVLKPYGCVLFVVDARVFNIIVKKSHLACKPS